jgi:hypothetical protein
MAGPKLSVGRGEKLSVRAGGGLTEKGRKKYNRATGSNLKAPTKDTKNPRHKSFCSRMKGVVRKSKGPATRARASLRRWGCR